MNNQNYNAGCYSVKEIMDRMRQRKLQKDVSEFVLFIGLIFLCYALMACSVKFEVGYHGETGRDDRTQTDVKRK